MADDAAHHLAGQYMRAHGGGRAKALGDRQQLGRRDRQPLPRHRHQRELVSHQLVKEQQPALQLQHLGPARRAGPSAQARLADAVERGEVKLDGIPLRQRPAAAQHQWRHRRARRRLDRQPRVFAQALQPHAHRHRHVGNVPALHRQAALAEHQPPLVQRQARQSASAHRDAPDIGDRQGVGHHLGRVGIGRVLVGLVGAGQRVDGQRAYRAQAGHIHGDADHVRQPDLARQGADQQVGIGDEAVLQQWAVERVGQRDATCQQPRQVMVRHRRGQHLRDVEQQPRGDLGHVGIAVQLQLGADREILGPHGAYFDEVFAQVARTLQRVAHGIQHRGALDLRIHRVHELDAHAVQAGQGHELELRMRWRRLAQLLAAQIGVELYIADALDPGVLDAGQVDQQLAPVQLGQCPIRQDSVGCMELRTTVCVTRQAVFDRQCMAVGQLGQRIANQLQHRDAGVVGVVVGPERAGQAPHLGQAFVEQRAGVEGEVGFGQRGDGREPFERGHIRAACVRWMCLSRGSGPAARFAPCPPA